MTKPILPTPDEIIGKGIDALVSLKPQALQFINNDAPGVYGNIFRGLRAQVALMLQRLASGVIANRVPLATGDDLVKLVSSEIGTPPALGARYASGTIRLTRYAPGLLVSGTIPAGTTFPRQATNGSLAFTGASYQTAADVSFGPTTYSADIPVVASSPGAAPNCPQLSQFVLGAATDNNQFVITCPSLFDPLFAVDGSNTHIAGGSDGTTNDQLRAWAANADVADNGPTNSNATAQVLIENGVSHFSILDDAFNGQLVVYVADISWASGAAMCTNVQSQLIQGFGAIVSIRPVNNTIIAVTAAIVLKQDSKSADQSAITANVQKSIRSYFDDRADWYTWSNDGLSAAIIQSDSHINSVTTVGVSYAMTNSAGPIGTPIAPPTSDPRYTGTTPNASATHFYLGGNAVALTFS